MNILQQQNSAKELSDQQLQQELLNPTGALPSYLALSELQRRKDMRSSYQSLQGKPGSSMAEEFARGLGGADVGKYGEAVRGAMPSSPGGEQPPMPPPMQPPMQAPMQPPTQPPMQDPMQQQQFAAGGAIMAPGATPAVGASMGTLGNYNSQNNNNGNSPPRKDEKDILAGFKKEDGSFNPAALGPLAGIIAGQSVGDSFKGFANSMIGPVPRLFGFKGFADGGPVGLDNGGGIYATKAPLAPSGVLAGQTTIEDILKGIGITNQRLGIAGASNMNPYEQAPRIDTFGGADSGGPGTGSASDSGTSSSNSAAADASAADASAASAGAASAGNSGDDGTGGGTGATYYRGGPVRFGDGGGVPSSWEFPYTPSPNLSYAEKIKALSQMRLGGPPSGPYSQPAAPSFGEKFRNAMAVPSSDLATIGAGAVKQGLANVPSLVGDFGAQMALDAEANRGRIVEDTKNIFTRDPRPDGKGNKDILHTWSDRRKGINQIPRAGGGVQDYPPDVLSPPEKPQVIQALGIDNTGWLEPGLDNSSPGGTTNDPSAKAPAGKGRPTPPPGGGSPNARGPSGDAGGGGGGTPNGGIDTALNPDLDGFVGQVRGLQLPDRFGEIEARNQQERDDLKAGRESDKGLAMLQAGMTMAGGTSPYALTNIAAGTNAGIKEWSSMEKEYRVANQAIRSAENAIQIARANRDERQLEMAVKVKMHFEEQKARLAATAATAAAAAGARADAANARADAREDNKEHRALVREQDEIKGLSDSYTKVQSHITSLGPKIAAAEAGVMAGEVGAKEARDVLKDQLSQYIQQRDAAYNMYQSSLFDRAGRKNNATVIRSKAEYNALPDGTRFLDTSNGNIGIKKSKKE